VPGNVTNKNYWGPNTLIKQGAKLVATWEDTWERLPVEIRLALEPREALNRKPRELHLYFRTTRSVPTEKDSGPSEAR
jgi:DNA processing protein